MIELFIAPHPNNPTSYSHLDLKEEEAILFSRKRTDYTNPTLIKNSFTKTLHLPGTKLNNDVFDEIYHLFRLQNPNDFNPSRRVPFKLLENGILKESGYLKLDFINRKEEEVTYECTLYGELGNILYNLSYKEDPNTFEVSPLTLADLNYNIHSEDQTLKQDFKINRNVVNSGWNHLRNPQSTDDEMYNVFNFIVAYNGQQNLNKFDNKLCMLNLSQYFEGDYRCISNGNTYNIILSEHIGFTEDGVPTTDPYNSYYIPTPTTGLDAVKGLIEFPDAVTDIETHDLRSYMQRPIIKFSAIFDAIDRYLDTNFGYHLIKEGSFWTTSDYVEQYMTLPLLSEIYPDIESDYTVKFTDMLSKTSSPASYLISFCKIFGIYLDVDVVDKQLILRRIPQFFMNKVNTGIIDVATEQKITPLSFDKSSYTFDYADSDNNRLKNYKEINGIAYGSKKVNTGYQFDAASAPYITNNVFKNATMSVLQSKYFRFTQVPRALAPVNGTAKFSLFHYNTLTLSYDTNETTLSSNLGGQDKKGYLWYNTTWQGLQRNVWNDGFPKLEFQSEDGKPVDGSNVLVKFQEFKDCKCLDIEYDGSPYSESTSEINSDDVNAKTVFFENETYSAPFIISDDEKFTAEFNNRKNFWIDSFRYGLSHSLPIITVNSLPMFSVMTIQESYIPSVVREESGSITGLSAYYCSITENQTPWGDNGMIFTPVQVGEQIRKYPYYTISNPKVGDRYFAEATVRCNSRSVFADRRILPSYGTIDDYTRYDNIGEYQTIGTLFTVISPVDIEVMFTQLSGYSDALYLNSYRIINLTELGLDKQITSIDLAFNYFGHFKGHNLWITRTNYFGDPRELFIPYAKFVKPGEINIYDRYWRNYISDIYNVNTRVLECKMKIDNYNTAFREFYTYDNCLWILSEVTDYDNETHTCKAKLLKVNDKNAYLSS